MTEQEQRFKAIHGALIYALSILALFVLQFVFSIIIIASDLQENTAPYNIISLLGSLIFQVGFLAMFFLYLKHRNVRPQIYLRAKISPWFYVTAVLLSLICIALFYPIGLSFVIFLEKVGFKSATSFAKGGVIQNIIMGVVVLAAPVGEELIYRSALLSGLSKRLNKLSASALSGLAFAFMHMNPHQTVFQFFLGFAAAYLALSAHSVMPAIVLHLTNNLTALIFTLTNDYVPLEYSRLLLSSNVAFTLSAIFMTVAGIGIIIFSCRFLSARFGDNSLEDKAQQPIDTTKTFYAVYLATLGVCVLIWIVSFFTP